MKVFAGQLYAVPGVSFPFSTSFQVWLGLEISARANASARFIKTYGDHWELMLRISSKSGIPEVEIKGPSVYKKTNTVEFSIFIPHERQVVTNRADYAKPLRFLFAGIAQVLQALDIDAALVEASSERLVQFVLSDPTMILEKEEARLNEFWRKADASIPRLEG